MPDTAPSLTAPALDDDAALHAVIPADVSGQDPTRTVCDLPIEPDRTYASTATLTRAQAVGVTCLICLGWLGARHETPPVVVRGSWFPHIPPSLPGESNEAFTNRLTGAAARKLGVPFEEYLTGQTDPYAAIPYDHRRNRQCSINYHDECSDPHGETCECPCHRQPPPGTIVIEADGVEYITAPAPSPVDALIEKIQDDVLDELMRARAKFPGQHLPLGFGEAADGWIPSDALHLAADWRDLFRALTDRAAEDGKLTWRHVLTEETFEAFAEDDPAEARKELAQLAAMCVRAMLDIDDPQPIAFGGPSGARWEQTGTDGDGNPYVARHVNDPLTLPAPAPLTSTTAPDGSDA